MLISQWTTFMVEIQLLRQKDFLKPHCSAGQIVGKSKRKLPASWDRSLKLLGDHRGVTSIWVLELRGKLKWTKKRWEEAYRASGRQKLEENSASQEECVRELWSDVANTCVPEQFPWSILVGQQKNLRIRSIKQDEIIFREKIQFPTQQLPSNLFWRSCLSDFKQHAAAVS